MMPARIVVPELGESVLEATVAHWQKKEGDQVSAGEVLVTLETDKVDLEVGAERSGVLAKIERHEGEDVKIGDVLGIIGESSTDGKEPQTEGKRPAAPAPAATVKTAAAEEKTARGPEPVTAEKVSAPEPESKPPEPELRRAGPAAAPSLPESASALGAEHAATPSARRIAQEYGVDLSQVPPSDGARVTGQDVLAYIDRSEKGAKGTERREQRAEAAA
jgi:2-oxoglutarate dehydrogenase E2 component (dihydrolipoamide succinyltransferase)